VKKSNKTLIKKATKEETKWLHGLTPTHRTELDKKMYNQN